MKVTEDIKISYFSTKEGGEYFISINPPSGLEITEALKYLFGTYNKVLLENKLSLDTEVLIRIFCSDISNQYEIIRKYINKTEMSSFWSLIEQKPLFNGKSLKLSLYAYHMKSSNNVIIKKNVHGMTVVEHGTYKTIWANNCSTIQGNAYEQTKNEFEIFLNKIELLGLNIQNNLIRTWIYVRDIDNNYHDMVNARRELFYYNGLTVDTHFVASTGIEGRCSNQSQLVKIDYLLMDGLKQKQIHYLKNEDYLCPTHKYGVTFERGTLVNFGDRRHYHISGTASIDKYGKILHKNNVLKQGERTLENINALLESKGSNINDMQYMIIYLRDTADLHSVEEFVRQEIPKHVVYSIVEGNVCDPNWLIEIEGVAITAHRDNSLGTLL